MFHLQLPPVFCPHQIKAEQICLNCNVGYSLIHHFIIINKM